jgi:hypothetical protein
VPNVTVEQVPGTDKTVRVTIQGLINGRYTRSFPHEIPDGALYVADNVVYNRDNLVSKRPGNETYGNGSGATGSGIGSLAGVRFYPAPVGTTAPQLLVHSGTGLYKGNDATGAFAAVNGAHPLNNARAATFAQMRDPDMSSGNNVALFICDGLHSPYVYDGANYVPVQTGAYAASGSIPGGNYLPNGVYTGTPIRPKFCLNWREHMVYGGDPDDPTGIWFSDASRPERFNGFSLTDSGGIPYAPYYPGGPDGALGAMTGFCQIGANLVIFFTQGVVTAINTGTYGVTQYQFSTISARVGMTSPSSLQVFDTFACFFGGDRFYATDGNTVQPLPDLIPDIYANNSQSTFPPDMKNKYNVTSARRGTSYWASYDNVGDGKQHSIVVFDTAANSGYTYGAVQGGAFNTQQGGAWARWPTGMPLSWGLECRGDGDNFQTFWGSSVADKIAQHDVGTYDDFGATIAIEIRAKAFFLDKMVNPKTVESLYIIGAYQTESMPYADSLTGYVVTDLSQSVAPIAQAPISPSGVPYGADYYGQVTYGAGSQIIQFSTKTYPQREMIGNAIQPGVIENSKNPFNLIGFVIDLIVDNPAP